ncbi:MAG TPA: hypothetical protein VEB65_07345 [Solirubrobacterales bacterium]|nr:hypothetical protein [Solirubrobacterales bacterium]
MLDRRITLEDWERRAAAARQVVDDHPAFGGEIEDRRAPRRRPHRVVSERPRPDPWWDGRWRRWLRRHGPAIAVAVGLALIALALFGPRP